MDTYNDDIKYKIEVKYISNFVFIYCNGACLFFKNENSEIFSMTFEMNIALLNEFANKFGVGFFRYKNYFGDGGYEMYFSTDRGPYNYVTNLTDESFIFACHEKENGIISGLIVDLQKKYPQYIETWNRLRIEIFGSELMKRLTEAMSEIISS